MFRRFFDSAVVGLCLAVTGLGNEPIDYLQPRLICKLENKRVSESSGLAVSRRNPEWFWTHNDSGDKARLYCFDLEGRHIGTCNLKKADAVDWEDICSFELDGTPKILIGDVGDNARRRKKCQLILLDEPWDPKKDIKKYLTFKLRYSADPIDCEAIGVDAINRKLLLVEKRRWINCRVFEVDLPAKDNAEIVVGERIAVIDLPLVTAMDISPDGLRAIVMTMGQAFEFTRAETESWKQAFSKKPRKIEMPPRKQGEAICYGANGRDLYLTSEAVPAPFFVVKAAGS